MTQIEPLLWAFAVAAPLFMLFSTGEVYKIRWHIMSLRPLSKIGRYTVVEEIGQGGMGQILLAYYLGFSGIKTPVAIKLLKPHKTSSEVIEHFKREAQLISKLRHNNIAAFHDMVVEGDRLALVLEFVEGVSLKHISSEFIKRRDPMPERYALYIMSQAALGLDYLHRFEDKESGKVTELIHGDVSPANIMINFEGEVKLIDFGLSRLQNDYDEAAMETKLASLNYTSPSRYLNKRVATSDDVFSLGICMWELLTGEQYHAKKTRAEVKATLKHFEARDPRELKADISPEVAEIVMRCLDAETLNGYTNINDVYRDLTICLQKKYPQFTVTSFREFICHHFAGELNALRDARRRHAGLLAA